MTRNQYGQRGLRAALGGGISAAALLFVSATGALAQQSADAGPVEEVVVTGSRVARPNLTAPVPLQQFTAGDIAFSGQVNTIDFVAQLPEAQDSQTGGSNNRFINGAGIDAINLRGLGLYRTLVLVDGLHHIGSLSGVNNSGGTPIVDTSTIPPLLIDHIDVVTQGSSAAYGADAVAGVVNFVMKKNYQGADLNVQGGGSEHGGAGTITVDAILGSNFANDRGNITFAFDYQQQEPVYASDRDYANTICDWTASPSDTSGNSLVQKCGLLANRYNATLAPVVYTAIGPNPSKSLTFSTDGTTLLPFNKGTTLDTNPNESINGQGLNTVAYKRIIYSPNIRTVGDTIASYHLLENVGPIASLDFKADVKFADSRGALDNAFEQNRGNFTPGAATSGLPINLTTNPYVPGSLAALGAANGVSNISIDRFNADWGPRYSDYEYQYYRGVFGFQGEFTNGWHYEAMYNYGHNQTDFRNGDFQIANLLQQIDAVANPNYKPNLPFNDQTNNPVICNPAHAPAPQPNCVPINPFRVGALTADQFYYSAVQLHEDDILTEEDWVVNLNGDVYTYPTLFSGVRAPIGMAVGFEHRLETTNSHPDSLALAPLGTIYGNQVGTSPTIGSYDTTEWYVETNVPILRDLPFAKAVDVDGAIRFQDYSTSGHDYTWNGTLSWVFSDQVRFRAGASQSVRAPAADELFTPPGESFVGIVDPCDAANINANPTRARNCAAVVPPGFLASNNPFGSIAELIGGNPNLKTEVGHGFTAGVVLTPSFIPRFEFTADYWHINVYRAIVAPDPNLTINGCYDNGVGCQFVHRVAGGFVQTVDANYQNLGVEKVAGLDVGARYLMDLDPYLHNSSNLNMSANVTYTPTHVLKGDPNNPAATVYLGGYVGYPRVKGQFRLSYSDDTITIGATTRYESSQQIYFPTPPVTYSPNSTGDMIYEDVRGEYRWRNMTFYMGVNNLNDLKPPQTPDFYQGGNYLGATAAGGPIQLDATNTFPTYDVLGRYWYGGIKVSF